MSPGVKVGGFRFGQKDQRHQRDPRDSWFGFKSTILISMSFK